MTVTIPQYQVNKPKQHTHNAEHAIEESKLLSPPGLSLGQYYL